MSNPILTRDQFAREVSQLWNATKEETMTSSLDDLFKQIHAQPRLHTRHEELGDNPATHRWRARWQYGEDHEASIELYPVPVIKATPTGAWIDPDAWREQQGEMCDVCTGAGEDGHGNICGKCDGAGGITRSTWHLTGAKRWVANDSGSAWAKPTRQAALLSLAVRLDRWAIQVANQLQRVRSAADAIDELLPEHRRLAQSARLRLPREQLDPDVIEAWLRRKYVQQADDRQKEMGLSYTTAETKDLAAAIARFYRHRG